MAREFLDYNPDTGMTYYTEFLEESQETRLTYEADVTPLLDHCMRLRNEGIHTAKDEMFHYAKIPPVVQVELLGKGLNIFSNDESVLKRIRQEIKSNYPYLRTSNDVHV